MQIFQSKALDMVTLQVKFNIHLKRNNNTFPQNIPKSPTWSNIQKLFL